MNKEILYIINMRMYNAHGQSSKAAKTRSCFPLCCRQISLSAEGGRDRLPKIKHALPKTMARPPRRKKNVKKYIQS